MYSFFPATAYNFNQQVEEHAYQTYTEYINDNYQYLCSQPAPKIAIDYYCNDVLFLEGSSLDYYCSVTSCSEIDESGIPEVVRPLSVVTLHDVFVHIQADEALHARTMKSLQTRTSLLSRGRRGESRSEESDGGMDEREAVIPDTSTIQ